MITSSQKGEVAFVNMAVALFVWFDATMTNKPQEYISLDILQKHKQRMTNLAWICAFMSVCLWVLSSGNVLVSIGEFWHSEIFRIILYSALFLMWFYIKYIAISRKTFTEAKTFEIDTISGKEIMDLGIIKTKNT